MLGFGVRQGMIQFVWMQKTLQNSVYIILNKLVILPLQAQVDFYHALNLPLNAYFTCYRWGCRTIRGMLFTPGA